MTAIDTTPFSHDGVHVVQLLSDLAGAVRGSLTDTPLGAPSVGGLWHDEPPEDCCDRALLWVENWVPTVVGEFPVQAAAHDRCKPVDMLPALVASVRRPCAPIPDANGYVDPNQETAAAEEMIHDARALTCGLFRDWPTILQAAYPQSKPLIHWAPMTPTGRNTNCFGWDWRIQIEITGCRGNCGQ